MVLALDMLESSEVHEHSDIGLAGMPLENVRNNCFGVMVGMIILAMEAVTW